MWTVVFKDQGKGVGTLEATYDLGTADPFVFTVSVDSNRVTDFSIFADKIKAILVEHINEKQKTPPWEESVLALERALNGGK